MNKRVYERLEVLENRIQSKDLNPIVFFDPKDGDTWYKEVNGKFQKIENKENLNGGNGVLMYPLCESEVKRIV